MWQSHTQTLSFAFRKSHNTRNPHPSLSLNKIKNRKNVWSPELFLQCKVAFSFLKSLIECKKNFYRFQSCNETKLGVLINFMNWNILPLESYNYHTKPPSYTQPSPKMHRNWHACTHTQRHFHELYTERKALWQGSKGYTCGCLNRRFNTSGFKYRLKEYLSLQGKNYFAATKQWVWSSLSGDDSFLRAQDTRFLSRTPLIPRLLWKPW